MLYQVCFVPYEAPVINGAYTPGMIITELLKVSFALYGNSNSFDNT